MTKVLYPGSFDPITAGHQNIVEQASKLFDEVIISVLSNPAKKQTMFTLEERVQMIKEIYQNSNIKVIGGGISAVDVALEYDCSAIIRGLRSLSDFDYEVQLSQINKQISNGLINTICLFADLNYQFVSSTMVKEVFGLGKNIDAYVSPNVYKHMLEKK